uniref:Uncharacterized protein n=1 Tax=uncultured marine virus TaxID=186617 RepID=A0A0F7L2I9_9VIRU|nr:hypothetical protein [uncultured marine virus]
MFWVYASILFKINLCIRYQTIIRLNTCLYTRFNCFINTYNIIIILHVITLKIGHVLDETWAECKDNCVLSCFCISNVF